uniref:UspA domain-containing protein n=1 Tax=Nelumbo nucifera TaxID=4432 RepID=A0A822XW72_NELNU|nr:TPA_asm: hypothetical protein HUJ06_026041 [Nelumbo nucifera]
MPSAASFFRQLSGRDSWSSSSNRWSKKSKYGGGEGCQRSLKQMEGLRMCGGVVENGGLVMRKRVMVVVDQSARAKHAMMWALTHVTNKGDLLTLLHIVPPPSHSYKCSERMSDSSPYLANSLGSLCKACKPEVFFLLCAREREREMHAFIFLSFLFLFSPNLAFHSCILTDAMLVHFFYTFFYLISLLFL